MKANCCRCRVFYSTKVLTSDLRLAGLRNRVFCDTCLLDEIEDQTAICPDCGVFHICASVWYPPKWKSVPCPKCSIKDREHLELIIVKHLRASRRANLPATLTVDEWYQTLYHFEVMCAYCQIRPYQTLEHFIPVKLGGGTTQGNCVPSCYGCNNLKEKLHPSDLLTHHSFPKESVHRVSSYLSQF